MYNIVGTLAWFRICTSNIICFCNVMLEALSNMLLFSMCNIYNIIHHLNSTVYHILKILYQLILFVNLALYKIWRFLFVIVCLGFLQKALWLFWFWKVRQSFLVKFCVFFTYKNKAKINTHVSSTLYQFMYHLCRL